MTNEEIYELIGAIAKSEMKNGNTKLKLSELAEILRILEIESDLWDYYKNRTDGIIRNAYKYFAGNPTMANDIKNTYIKKNGDFLIP
jgi:hypothetical protein